MSLSAVLKAGLSARDANETEAEAGWDPYPSGEERAKPVPALKPVGAKRAAPIEPTLGAGLSDSLPKPKITVPPTRQPANANASSDRGAREPKARRQAVIEEIAGVPMRKSGRVNPQQYIRELDRYQAEQNRHLTQDAVMDVASHEVECVAKLAAKVRGRYIAKLLDAGNSQQADLKEAELAELRRYRESHEELCHGLDLLKSAIAEGDINVSGMIKG